MKTPEISKDEYYKLRDEVDEKYSKVAENDPERIQAYYDLHRKDKDNKGFYDEAESEWMKTISPDVRRDAALLLTRGSYEDQLTYDFPGPKKIFLGIKSLAVMSILDCALYAASKFFPAQYQSISLLSIPISNLGICYWLGTVFSGLDEQQRRFREEHDHYLNKSMEYILRAAHQKGLFHDKYTPSPEKS